VTTTAAPGCADRATAYEAGARAAPELPKVAFRPREDESADTKIAAATVGAGDGTGVVGTGDGTTVGCKVGTGTGDDEGLGVFSVGE
jgi:hypothetical protein